MKLWNTNPAHGIRLTGGKGSALYDDQGRTYIDMFSGTWCNVLGYSHPRLRRAVEEQAQVFRPGLFDRNRLYMGVRPG